MATNVSERSTPTPSWATMRGLKSVKCTKHIQTKYTNPNPFTENILFASE